jgi:hypothetical protein
LKQEENGSRYCMPDIQEFNICGTALTEILSCSLLKNTPLRLKVRGFSMLPFIRDEDIVTISPLLNSSLALGFAVAFTHPQTGRLTIHRIIAKRGNFYLIKGDCINKADGLIPKKNILGTVTKIERNGKKVLLGLGPERILIAFLNRLSFFFPLLLCGWKFLRQPVFANTKKS